MSTDLQQLLDAQALSAAVQRATREVIRAAARTVQRLEPRNDQLSGMRENQLRNVVNVALGAPSVEEIAAFIMYQMGRNTNSRAWLYGNFGLAVVEELMSGSVFTAAQRAVEDMIVGHPQHEPNKDQLIDQAHILLARQYLGYLNRFFFFAAQAERLPDRTSPNQPNRWAQLRELIKEGSRD
jgi:hypothetical protein